MKYTGLYATADIVGRRLWIGWEFILDVLETPSHVPAVRLRRKERDYDFPPFAPGDPYTVYESTAFPPAPVPGVLQVLDLPGWETEEDGQKIVASAISVSAILAGTPQEFLRRVMYTTYGPDGAPVAVRCELLDARSLTPHTPYYYELDDGSAPDSERIALYRAMAVPGDTYGLNRRFYEMLPAIYTRHDVRRIPPQFELPGVPESSPNGGQLRRFVDMFGMGLDSMRSSAENLLDLYDIFNTQARLLPPLSRSIGWEPTSVLGIPTQRNELLTATRLLDVVGTVPALRALVTYQTGWHSQVAEYSQHVARSNRPAARSLYGAEEQAGGVWIGSEDAAPLLGFPAGEVTGAGAAPAVLTSAQLEPFPLRSGMELTITVDGDTPARVRFGPDDFVNIGAATAAEVAAAISAAFDALIATDVAGAVQLTTHAIGPEASLEVAPSDSSLIALDDVATGPLSALQDGVGRIRLFFEQKWASERPEQSTFPADGATLAPAVASAVDVGRAAILYKCWGYGEWRDSLEVPDWTGRPAAPQAALLDDGRVWLCWIDRERTDFRRLRFSVGAPRQATPAVITGERREPFTLIAGTVLTLTGSFGTEAYTVQNADYADPANATAVEVAAAMNAQLAQLTASVVAGGAVRVSSVATGADVQMGVDLAASTAARSLGLGSRNLLGRGDWDATIDWGGSLAMPTLWGKAQDPAAVRDPLGGVRAFWSEHQDGSWQVRQAHWSELLTVTTPAGVAQRSTGPWQVWQMADGLPSNDVRGVAVDADGTLWFATTAGLASRRPDNVWTVLTTADGLSSDDIRDLALLPAGRLWCATPAGISVVTPTGAVAVITAAGGGLIDDDVRAVAADGAGNGWAAAPAGVSRRDRNGLWQSWTAADGLAAAAPRALAVGAGDRVALATSAGVSIMTGGRWTTYSQGDGLASDDVRDVYWDDGDTLYAATVAGLAIWNGRSWRNLTAANGLPSSDIRAVTIAPDGQLIVGTAGGLAIGNESAWTVEDVASGLPANTVADVHLGWSSPVILARGQGGNVEPRAAVDAAGRTWLVWSQREQAAATPADTWTLRLRRFDPAAATWAWGPPQTVTSSVVPVSDRQPTLEPDAGGGFRVFFSSDRSGGRKIWWAPLDNAGVAGALASFPDRASESSSPASVAGPDGDSWLFYRGDDSLVQSQAGILPTLGARSSQRVPDAGALRLRTGTRTAVLAHTTRNVGRGDWGDLYTYTPQHPDKNAEEMDIGVDVATGVPLEPPYTRRTIGLFLRQSRTGIPFTPEQLVRLLQIVKRFLPLNLRVALVIRPGPGEL